MRCAGPSSYNLGPSAIRAAPHHLGGDAPRELTASVGRGAANALFVIGPRAAPDNQSRVLGQIVDSVNATQRTPLVFDRGYDSPTHPERPFFRSDHYNYSRRGIPVVLLTTGLHADYHTVRDESSKVDYAKLVRVATLMHDVAVAVGNRRTRPR